MPAPATLAQVYCTDEDIARRAPEDYFALAPRSQRRAFGTDGVFAAGVPSWTLASATVPFGGQGVAPNNVLLLTKAGAFQAAGELFAVESTAAQSATLRRIGEAAGVGQPPGPASGLTGVTFECRTFATQIDNASYDANKFFGIDPNLWHKSPGRLYDPRELTMFVVLTVLKRAYIDKAKAKAEDYAEKLALIAGELEDLRARLVVQWGDLADGNAPSSVFATRTRR